MAHRCNKLKSIKPNLEIPSTLERIDKMSQIQKKRRISEMLSNDDENKSAHSGKIQKSELKSKYSTFGCYSIPLGNRYTANFPL